MSLGPLLLFLVAQDDAPPSLPATEPPPIIVSGRGLAPGRGDTAQNSIRIGRERLNNSAANRLETLLRDVAGFQQFRRSDARSANPTSQGATFRALGGNASSRVLLLLDGVPQADPFGGWIAWPALDPRRLSEMRVMRGGGSGAAGPGALAGTIEMASAGRDEVGRGAAETAYGSRHSFDLFAATTARLGDGFVSLAGNWAQGDGFMPVIADQRGAADRPSPYRQRSLALRAAAPLAATSELQANLLLFDDRRERGTAFSDIATSGADGSLRLVGSGETAWTALAYVQLRDFSNRFAAVTPGRASASLTLDQHSVPATGLGGRVELRPSIGSTQLRLGADARLTAGRTHELFQFVAGEPTRSRAAGGRSWSFGGFAELGLESGPFTLSAGLRADRWRIEDGVLRERRLADDFLLTDLVFPDRSGWEASGRLAASWRVSGAARARAAAYRGWRLPTLNELYRPFRVGADATAANAALDSERLDGVEAGLALTPARGVELNATLFANRLEDAIANVTLGQGPGQFPGVGFVAAGGQFRQRQNVDAVVSRGVEIDASFARSNWRARLSYAFADAEMRAPGLPLDRLRPAQSPRHGAAVSIGWQHPDGTGASLAAYSVGRQFEDDLNRQALPAALSFDAVVNLPLSGALALQARAENLTDEKVVAGVSGAGVIERATPRTLWVGIRFRR
ncbi:MAG: TonB-dependent receptor [Sphingosinicella sp.]